MQMYVKFLELSYLCALIIIKNKGYEYIQENLA